MVYNAKHIIAEMGCAVNGGTQGYIPNSRKAFQSFQNFGRLMAYNRTVAVHRTLIDSEGADLREDFLKVGAAILVRRITLLNLANFCYNPQ